MKDNQYDLIKKYGFISHLQTMPSLPEQYKCLDEYADQFKGLIESSTLIKKVSEMPLLDISNLEDKYLQRASIILSYLAHAYLYEQKKIKNDNLLLPESIEVPWVKLSQRLSRANPAFTIYEAVLHNWQLKNDQSINKYLENPENLTIDDFKPIVHTFGHTDTIFHLTILEMEIKAIPLIRAIIQVNEAFERKDENSIVHALRSVIHSIWQIKKSLHHVNLNKSSNSHVDPLVWCNTVALFTASTRDNEPGMSGLGSPLFHLLDHFIGRDIHHSTIGKLAHTYFGWLKIEHRTFIKNITYNIAQKLNQHPNSIIRKLFRDVIDVYAGKEGLLSYHQDKILGYLNLMSLTTRQKTNANLAMTKIDHLQVIANTLKSARQERTIKYGENKYQLASKTHIRKLITNYTHLNEIEFDYPSKIDCFPGSICKVTPENNHLAVTLALKKLHRVGNEKVNLSIIPYTILLLPEEQSIEQNVSKPSQIFLKFINNQLNAYWQAHGTIQSKSLYLTDKEILNLDIILHDNNSNPLPITEQLLVNKIISVCGLNYSLDKYFIKRGIDISDISLDSLLKHIDLSDIENWPFSTNINDYLALMRPIRSRPYSIISNQINEIHSSTKLKIIVKYIENGKASNFLESMHNEALIRVKPNDRFEFTCPSTTPLALFASGTGINAFLSYLAINPSNKIHLFLSFRQVDEFNFYKNYLFKLKNFKSLDIHIILTQDKLILRKEPAMNDFKSTVNHTGRIDNYLLENDSYKLLSTLMSPKKIIEENVKIYICGNPAFSNSIQEKLKLIINKNNENEKNIFAEMIADNRICVSAPEAEHTSYHSENISIPLHQLIYHNNSKKGHWVAINGKVYDLSKFIHHHPGGNNNILQLSGTDMSYSYNTLHAKNPHVNGVLSTCVIGNLNDSPNVQLKIIIYQCTKIENEIQIIQSYDKFNTLYLVRINNALNESNSVLKGLLNLKSTSNKNLFDNQTDFFENFIKNLSLKLELISLNQNDTKDILVIIKRIVLIIKFSANQILINQSLNIDLDLIKRKISLAQESIDLIFAKYQALNNIPFNLMNEKNHSLAIIGGSLTGLVLAIFLKNFGHDVHIYEKFNDPRQDDSHSSASFNITLCERGLNALASINLKEKVIAASIPLYGRKIHTLEGKIKNQPYGPNNEALFSIKREYLINILLHEVESKQIPIYFGSHCKEFNFLGSSVEFIVDDRLSQTQYKVRADHLFGADGANSEVRTAMEKSAAFPKSKISTHEMIYREIYLPADKNGSYLLEKNKLHIWPRDQFMLIGFPNQDGSFTLSLFAEKQIKEKKLIDNESTFKFIKDQFPDISPYIEKIIINEITPRWGELKRVHCNQWHYKDKVLLLGDAAHAFYPFYGQAANCAFEDCLHLAKLILENKSLSVDWNKLFMQFASRKKDVNVIADLAEKHNHTLSKTISEEEYLLRSEIEREITRQYPTFGSLYHNISFTQLSYSDSLSLSQTFTKTTEEIYQRYSQGRATSIADCVKEVLASTNVPFQLTKEKIMKILVINSSINSQNSTSRTLTHYLTESLTKKFAQSKIMHRDLLKNPVPHLTEESLDGLSPNPIIDVGHSTRRLSDELIAEFTDADMIVLGVPMYNFSIPSTLKSYFDHIVRFGVTFSYNEKGQVGLLNDKPVAIITTGGGIHQDTPRDFQSTYLRQLFNFIGVSNLSFIRAHGLLIPNQSQSIIETAKSEIDHYVEQLAIENLLNQESSLSAPANHQLEIKAPSDYLSFSANLFKHVKEETYVECGVPLAEEKVDRNVLDVGCGTGIDTLALSSRVSPTSKIVGVDIEATSIEEANAKAKQQEKSNVSHLVMDSNNLEFEDEFDSARSERLFQHLVEPEKTLHAMVKAVKPNGKVVIADTDWESLQSDELTQDENQAIANFFCDKLPNGRIAKKIATLCEAESLENIKEKRVRTYLSASDYNQITLPQRFFKSCFPTQQACNDAINKITNNHNEKFGSIESVIVSGTKKVLR